MADHLVRLTWEELKRAAYNAVDRKVEDLSHGLQVGGKFIAFDGQGWKQDVLGSCGEAAFARFRGIPWQPAPMKGVDVDGHQVRSVIHRDGQLAIRSGDRDDHPFVLVSRWGISPQDSWTLWNVRGWVTGRRGREIGTLKDPHSRGVPAYFVNPEDLWDFEPRRVAPKTPARAITMDDAFGVV